jgi:hypothetical protein
MRISREALTTTVLFYRKKLEEYTYFFLNLYFHKYSNGNNTVLMTTLKAAFLAEFYGSQ